MGNHIRSKTAMMKSKDCFAMVIDSYKVLGFGRYQGT
jgi:hypothetical protein